MSNPTNQTTTTESRPAARVAIVGGGLAGMAAAVALAPHGYRVELFEARRRLGGRAASFRDVVTGQVVDQCQHISLGCCTQLADFRRRIGMDDGFRREATLHFFGPDGRQCDFSASRLLPAPLHLGPALFGLKYLTLAERWSIARAIGQLAREPAADRADGATIGHWLRERRQTPAALERFWSPVLVSALGETLDRASLAAARKVFVDGFLASRRGYELEVPRVPLADLFDRRAGQWLARAGVTLRLATRVRHVRGDGVRAFGVELADGTRHDFDRVIVAVPWNRVRRLFSDEMAAALPMLGALERIEPSPITAVHLWFDRPITPLPHAMLVGRLGQWFFADAGVARTLVRQTSRLLGSARSESVRVAQQQEANRLPFSVRPEERPPCCDQSGADPASPGRAQQSEAWHCQVVISASRALAGRTGESVIGQIQGELADLWPQAREARLLHARVVTHPAAVFSVLPGIGALRPPQRTPVANLFLAGDWTATLWPATMEGAVRSGFLAAEGVKSEE
ncbi:MAG: hydroxysqualene dehydroxylase HpnE [Pirellulales bacterium]